MSKKKATTPSAKSPHLKSNRNDVTPQAEPRQLIREAGLRATPGRIEVLKLLLESSGPLNHAEVVSRIRQPGPDASTIFRALNDLVESGLLHRLELGDHTWRYEPAKPKTERSHQGQHPHFLCLDCGDILCLEISSLANWKQTVQRHQTIGEVTEILLKGKCNSCR